MKEKIKNVGRALGYGGVYLGGQLIGGAATSIGILYYTRLKCSREGIENGNVFMERYHEAYVNSTGLMIGIAALITLIFLAIFFKVRKEKFGEKVNVRKTTFKAVGISALTGLLLCFTILGVLINLPISVDMIESYNNAANGLINQSFLFAVIGNILAAPILEEIIFRGLIFDRFRKAMPVVPAAIISSVLFGLAHGQIIWICYATVLGLVLAYIVYRTGSIIPSMVAHMALNATSTFMNYAGTELPEIVYTVVAVISIIAVVLYFVHRHRHLKNNEAEVKVASVTM